MALEIKKPVIVTNDALNLKPKEGNLRCVEFKKYYVIYKRLIDIKEVGDLINTLKQIKIGNGQKFWLSGDGQSKALFDKNKEPLNNDLQKWMQDLSTRSEGAHIQSENEFMSQSSGYKIDITHKDLIDSWNNLNKKYRIIRPKLN